MMNKRKIYCRAGKDVGYTTGGGYECKMEGCRSHRIGVRWNDGKLTFPCESDLVIHKDGEKLS